MKKITENWINKAEEDFSVARGLIRRRSIPANSICFCCQQMAEKYLKGLLQENMIRFSKTHDLVVLLELARPGFPSLGLLLDDFKFLGKFAVSYRYPGVDAEPREAKAAVSAARRIRTAIRLAIQA